MKESTFTYQTRLKSLEEVLPDYARLFSQLERKLFAAAMSGKELFDLKSFFISEYKITARQFNSLACQLKGKIASQKEIQKNQIKELRQKIELKEKELKKVSKEKAFSKQRSLTRIKNKLASLEKLQEEGRVSLCFGSRKLFRKQFQTEDHQAWKDEWIASRDNSFFSLGSKDETAGNQSCTLYTDAKGTFSLRLRLPDALKRPDKYFIIEDIDFAYGKEAILEALEENQKRSELQRLKDPSARFYGKALSFRFSRDKKGWRLFTSITSKKETFISKKERGIIGVDINTDHLALVETDRFGNPIASKKIPLNLYGKSKQQSKALIGNAVKEIIQLTVSSQKPLAVEDLDFQKKKKQLKSRSFNRVLSSFSYAYILQSLESRAWKDDIEVISIFSAYTSFMGKVKYTSRYGISNHQAAALCIGRRALGFSEKLPWQAYSLLGSEPVRNRSLDSWKKYEKAAKKKPAAHVELLKAKRTSTPSQILRGEKPLGKRGEIPSGESLVALLGQRDLCMYRNV